ncbi:MAG: glycosyltransferase family 4 protein [Tissierellia bacterium]|nr:glycosyltransferase family 4 protein [Tissierellia bacterium]
MTSNKVKVLLVSPYSGAVGGISRWTGHILNYHNSISASTSIELEQFYVDGEQIYNSTTPYKRFLYGIKKYIPFLKILRRKLRSTPYDIVHFCSSASISLIRDILAAGIAKKHEIPSVFHFHFGRIPELYEKRNWEQKLIHRLITLAGKIIVIDQASYDTLMKEGYNNIELLPNPLTPEVNRIISENSFIKRDSRQILFAGHVVKTKGVFELIEACREIPNIKVKMIGRVSDDMRSMLMESAGVDNSWLEISGELSYESTIIEMLSCGLFVLPTYTEGFPNVIIESMACGCPIIASSVGAIPEMLNIQSSDACGICIEPKDVIQLNEAIVKLLDDESLAFGYGERAKERVNEKYTMDVVWEQMVGIWESTLHLS